MINKMIDYFKHGRRLNSWRELNDAYSSGCEAGAIYVKELREENARLHRELETAQAHIAAMKQRAKSA